jgi:ribosomal protein S18 acetylase RimI-like enzyme
MIRNARPDDFDAVQSLYHALLEFEKSELGHDVNPAFAFSNYGVECLKDFVCDTKGRMAIIYEDNGIIVGYASLRSVPDQEVSHRENVKQAEIETICVMPEFRGKGIGRALLEECKKIVILNGYTHLKIVSLAININARKFYNDFGFKELSVVYEMEI